MGIPFVCALLLFGCDKARTSESSVPATPTQTAAQASARTSAVPSAALPESISFSFDAGATGSPPRGFVFGRTGGGAVGRWIVQADPTATSAPNVLAQIDADATNFRFPVAVTEQSQPADVRVSVRCKLISGRVDRACGLVLRYANADNYFITRANALEDNVRLYWVKEGKRKELASHDVDVTPNVWLTDTAPDFRASLWIARAFPLDEI